MPEASVNGIQIAYEVRGAGQPLLLIAGLSYDRWMWHRLAPGLARRFQVVLFDNRGVGRSSRPAGPYSAELLAQDTVGLMDALGIERAAVLGFSMGGFVAQALALAQPERLSHLVLAATNFGGPNHVPAKPDAMALLLDPSGSPEDRVRRGIEISCAPGFAARETGLLDAWIAYRVAQPIDPASYQAQLAIGLGLLSPAASFESRLPGLRLPVLILFGEHDQVAPPANVRLLAAAIPGAQVVILKGAGHFFPLEAPAAAAEAILGFLTMPAEAGRDA